MGRRLVPTIFAMGLLVLVLLGTGGPIASAQGSCDDIVVDEAGVFGSKIDQVTTEAQKLVNLGADPRIRTIKTFGSAGNLDNYVGQIQKNCKSWQATDGGRKNNLVVLIIAVNDRKTGLYYGSQWERVLGPNWTRIQTDKMNPRFRDGDFAGGFIAGLQEVQRLVDLEVHPPTPAPAQPPVVVVQPTQPPAPPLDLSGLWEVLKWIVALLVLAVAGYFAYRFVTAYLTEVAKRRAAQQKARLAKQATASRITEWSEEFQSVELQINTISAQVAKAEAEPLQNALTEAQRLYDKATMTYADLQSSAGDPNRPNLTEDEYQNIEEAYNNTLATLQEAETLLNGANRQAEALGKLVNDTPKMLAMAKATVERSRSRISTVAQTGFKTTQAEATLNQAQTALTQAETSLKEKRFQAAQKGAEEALKLSSEAIAAAETLPKQKTTVEQAIAALARRIESFKSKIIAGRETFEVIAANYAQSCWTPVRGNGTEAENRINWSLQALDAAGEAVTMEKQQWQKAQDQVSRANGWLDEAESFMRSITALKTNLEAAKRDATGEIQAAQADIDKARSYITHYDEDIRESLETDLAKAQESVDQTKAELAKEKPDYLKVVKLARNANDSADRILAEARSEHEAAERLRQHAASSLRDAQAAVSRAQEYLEDHSSDVGRSAKNYLEKAQETLRSAEQATSLESRIRSAEEAGEMADKAYSKAENDVEEKEEARRPRYVSAGYSGWGSPSSHRDDDDIPSTPSRRGFSDDRGGSSGWGSSGGGGGSSGWGSSGGGGGSTGW